MRIRSITIRTFALAALLVLPLGAQEKVKFTKKDLAKGAKMTVARTTNDDVKQTQSMAGQEMTFTQTSKSRDVKTFTVQEISAKGVIKAKVEFKTFDNVTTIGMMGRDQDQSETSLLTGKTYLLTLGEAGLIAKSEEGEDVKTEELEELRKRLKGPIAKGVLVDPHQRMDEIIGEREMAIGDTLKIGKEKANKIFGAEESGSKIESMSMKLKGTKSVFGTRCAIFAVTLELDVSEMTARGLEVTSDIKGEFVVGIENLWSYSASVKGPINGRGTVATPQGDAGIALEVKVAMAAMAAFE